MTKDEFEKEWNEHTPIIIMASGEFLDAWDAAIEAEFIICPVCKGEKWLSADIRSYPCDNCGAIGKIPKY